MKLGAIPNSLGEEKENGKIISDSEHAPGCREFQSKNQAGLNKVNLPKGIGDREIKNAFYGGGSYISKEGDGEIKRRMWVPNRIPNRRYGRK